jgi:hypothetical protein
MGERDGSDVTRLCALSYTAMTMVCRVPFAHKTTWYSGYIVACICFVRFPEAHGSNLDCDNLFYYIIILSKHCESEHFM